MSTQTISLSEVISESELANPCQYFTNDACHNEATWAVWALHCHAGCPGSFYTCDDCKQRGIDVVMDALKNELICGFCRQRVTGQVSDNLRFIEL